LLLDVLDVIPYVREASTNAPQIDRLDVLTEERLAESQN